MTVLTALECVAKDTWERLRDSESLDIRFGEETITDLVLLELKRMREPGIRIVQTNKHKEKTSGTDWEWWLGAPKVGWLRFAIQAKKLNLRTLRYDHLNHNRGSQISLLQMYAKSVNAIPIYCLFNFAQLPKMSKVWQCCETLDEPQLACTLTPTATITSAIASRGRRNFTSIHKSPKTLPWRCIAKCPKILNLYKNASKNTQSAIEIFGEEVTIYKHLPSNIEFAQEKGFVHLEGDNQNNEFYKMRPRYIAILEIPICE